MNSPDSMFYFSARHASPVDHTLSFCSDSMIPDTKVGIAYCEFNHFSTHRIKLTSFTYKDIIHK